jgi:hypothetical protein
MKSFTLTACLILSNAIILSCSNIKETADTTKSDIVFMIVMMMMMVLKLD